jgi:hypothetical protein
VFWKNRKVSASGLFTCYYDDEAAFFVKGFGAFTLFPFKLSVDMSKERGRNTS